MSKQIIALITGCIVILAAVALWPMPSVPASSEVKQNIIPMSQGDFSNDPNIQNAIQTQLEGKPAASQEQGVGTQLQPSGSGLQ